MKTLTLRFDVEGFDGGIESRQVGDLIVIAYQGMPVMSFPCDDLTLRDWTIASLLDTPLKGKAIAKLCHTTPSRVSEVKKRIRKGGLMAISHSGPGRKPKLIGQRLTRAIRCRRQGMTIEQIAELFGVSGSVATRALRGVPRGVRPEQVPLDRGGQPQRQPSAPSAVVPWPDDSDLEGLSADDEEPTGDHDTTGEDQPEELLPGQPLPAGEVEHQCRYAGTLLICAAAQALGLFAAMVKASVRRPKAAIYSAQQAIVALLCAWASGLGSIEAMHERDARALGVVLGLERSPSVRTLHRAIAQMVEVFDPVALLSQLLQGLIAAVGQVPRIFGVDGHFKPYFGKEPIDKGYDTKRRIAQKGLGNVLVHDEQGRLWLGVEVSPGEHLHEHLTSTAQTLRAELGEDEPIVLGFDRGGWCFETFNELDRGGFGYVAWMPSTVKTPELSTIAPADDDGVGELLFEHRSLSQGHRARLLVERDGQALVPAMTNLGAEVSADEALEMLRSVRGMQENDIKASRAFAHIDRLVDRGGAEHRGDDRPVDNPEHVELKQKRRKVRDRLKELGRRHPISRKDQAVCGGEELLAELEEALLSHQMSQIPKEVERQRLDPEAQRAWLKTKNRALLQPLKYLLSNARRWLLSALGLSLAPSDHEWDQSAVNRTLEALLRAPGVIRFGHETVEVWLDLPLPPQPHARLTRGLEMLSELNLHFSDGARPVVFRLLPRPNRASLPSAQPLDGQPGNSNL